jgi:hypothetical protein
MSAYNTSAYNLPANVPVLCIPRVYPNISESRIRYIFNELNIGVLDRIDIIKKQSEKGDHFNRVFVHFSRWNNNENACIARDRLLNGKEFKIIYDDPWFWKVSAYREPERRGYESYKPRVQFDAAAPRQSNNYRDQRYTRDTRDTREERNQRPPYSEKPSENPSKDTNNSMSVDYGNIVLPPMKKRNYKSAIKIKEEVKEESVVA